MGRTPRVRENLPAPNTSEGEYFNYTPDEAAPWTPFVARTLRERAYHREIPHVNNGRVIYFLGRQIVEINTRYAVKPFTAPRDSGGASDAP